MFWVCTELEQPLWSMGKHRFALPKDHRVPAMLETARFEWSRAAPVLASALTGREFLVGDRFTLADIFAAHTLLWARGFSVDFGSPVLEDYLDRQLARPAYARTHTPPTA
jgi:glutathione S-transferase